MVPAARVSFLFPLLLPTPHFIFRSLYNVSHWSKTISLYISLIYATYMHLVSCKVYILLLSLWAAVVRESHLASCPSHCFLMNIYVPLTGPRRQMGLCEVRKGHADGMGFLYQLFPCLRRPLLKEPIMCAGPLQENKLCRASVH